MLQQQRKHSEGLVLKFQADAVLVHLARTQVHLKGAEARTAGSSGGIHGRLSCAGTLSPIASGRSDYVPVQTRVGCNFPEFKELHGQTQNRCRPDARHCAANTFAPISPHSDKSTIEETTEG